MKINGLMLEDNWIDDAKEMNPELTGNINEDMARYITYEKGNSVVNFDLLEAELSHSRFPGTFYMMAVHNAFLKDILSKDIISINKKGNFVVIRKDVFYDVLSQESHEIRARTGEYKIARVEEDVVNPRLDKRFSGNNNETLYFTREDDAIAWKGIQARLEQQLCFGRQISYKKLT